MKKRIVCVIAGRVQGVMFRAYTKSLAKRNGITGYVENRDDGTVYVEAEGEEDDLKKFVQGLRTGSRWSKVSELKTQMLEELKNFGSFEIRYKNFWSRF